MPKLPGGGLNPNKSRLGYMVESCTRFDGGVDALAVNPRTGTVYTADNARYRVLCFQPDFHFDSRPLKLIIGQPAIGITGAGGLSPLHFSADEAKLPPSLRLDPEDGVITGTPAGQPREY